MSEPLRIAQVAPLYERVPPRLYGGTERVVNVLTEELVRRGHDVTLFASGDSDTKAHLISVPSAALELSSAHGASERPHHPELGQVLRSQPAPSTSSIATSTTSRFPSRGFRALRTVTHDARPARSSVPARRCSSSSAIPIVVDQRCATRSPWLIWTGRAPSTTVSAIANSVLHPRRDYLAFLGRISPEKRPDLAIALRGARSAA